MTISSILFNTIAIALIIAVIWWFFGNKIKPAISKTNKVLVKDGIYQPAAIQIPANREVKLTFQREDEAACAATVVFDGLDLAVDLPLHKEVEITLPPQKEGEITFACQMNMYRGKIVVA